MLSAGANVEVPSVEFSARPAAGRLRFQDTAEEPKPNKIRDSMKIIARAVGQASQRSERTSDSSDASAAEQERTASNVLKLSLRHPRPVYFEPPDGKSLDYDPVFMMSSPASWNDNQPFPTRERTPHYERPKEDDPTKGTVDEPRRGPFPLGVAVKTTVPAAWYSDKPDQPPDVRLVVIGHGGWFVGNDLSPAKEQLLLNTCNWLLGRDDRLTTEKGPLWKYPRATMSPRVQFLWLSGACIGLPLLFLYLGLMVLLVRRLR